MPTAPAKTSSLTISQVDSAQKQLELYKTKVRTTGEHAALKLFPIKVAELSEMLASGQFEYDRLEAIMQHVNIPSPSALLQANGHATATDGPTKAKRMKSSTDSCASDSSSITEAPPETDGTKVISFVCGTVACNSELSTMVELVKPVLREAVELFNQVKIWLVLQIPRIEDGNNFGVQTQEEVLSEVRTVESESASFLDQLTRYYQNRGRMVTKIARYPHVDDFRRAIVDLDEKQFMNIRLVMLEMRNHYSTSHDLITKNIDKIRTPRSNNMDSMY